MPFNASMRGSFGIQGKFSSRLRTRNIVTSGLILDVDSDVASSYPGSGATWFDLSGNENHITLFNNPTFNSSSKTFTFNGTNNYARTASSLNLSSFNSVTVEIVFKVFAVTGAMLFEHTPDWNTNVGAFGLAPNSNGSAPTSGVHHTNHNGGSSVFNYNIDFGINTWTSHVNCYSRISDSNGRFVYVNGSNIPPSTGSNSTSGGSFTNSNLFIASRNGSLSFNNCEIGEIRIYNRKLSPLEIAQNLNYSRSKFAI